MENDKLSDPVFALIEAHKRTATLLNEAIRGEDACTSGSPTGSLRDGELLALETQTTDATHANAEAVMSMISMPPTTLGGMLALVQHIQACEQAGHPVLTIEGERGIGYRVLVDTLTAGLRPFAVA
jgi:hypothetical protein